MADQYIINFTDSNNGSFVIAPYTMNGPESPALALPLAPSATLASTSLALPGKGIIDYGEYVVEDLVHLLEHFANPTPPAYSIQGQVWFNNTTDELSVYDGVGYHRLVRADNPVFEADLDMDGNAIINLQNAANPTDALNLQTGDARYVMVTGDTMTGTLTMAATLILSGAPILPLEATTKQYVDDEISTSIAAAIGGIPPDSLANLSDVTITAPAVDQVLRYSGTEWVNYTVPTPYVLLSGSVMTGALTLNADPVAPLGAATKQYVDDAVALVSGGGVANLDDLMDVAVAGVVSGEFLSYDGSQWVNSTITLASDTYVDNGALVGFGYATLTLTQTNGGPTISVPGIATTTHTHLTSQVYHDTNPTNDRSYLRDRTIGIPSYPQRVPLAVTVTLLDEAVSVLRSVPARAILEADGVEVLYDVPEYLAGAGRLDVFVNGVKSYASTRGTASIFIDGGPVSSPTANSGTDTTLTNGSTYDIRLWNDSFASLVTVSFTAASSNVLLDVVGANPTTDVFMVTGNYLTTFTAGKTFTITGSVAHNGTYTVATATYNGTVTSVEVVEDIISALTEGTITVAQITFANLVDSLNDAIGLTALADDVIVAFQDGSLVFIPTTQGDASKVVIYDGVGANPLISELSATFTATAVEYDGYGSSADIYQANNTTDVFTVPGDREDSFVTGARFAVTGSVGNDGNYTVIAPGGVYAAGYTTIPVTATTIITNETAGNGTGTIAFSRSLGYTERDQLGFLAPALETANAIEFTTAPTLGSIIEVIAHR